MTISKCNGVGLIREGVRERVAANMAFHWTLKEIRTSLEKTGRKAGELVNPKALE